MLFSKLMDTSINLRDEPTQFMDGKSSKNESMSFQETSAREVNGMYQGKSKILITYKESYTNMEQSARNHFDKVLICKKYYSKIIVGLKTSWKF